MAGHYLMLSRGVTIAYAESVETVPANMAEVRPTVMCSVPRLYEKMYARVLEKVAADPPLRQKHLPLGARRGARGASDHRVAQDHAGPARCGCRRALADRLVFAKIRERVGGRLRLFVSGGAPLSREIAEFFGAAGLHDPRGLRPHRDQPRHLREPPGRLPARARWASRSPGVEVKIAPDGEILTRGPHVMKGYYNKPAATRRGDRQDGWFHTGDIGFLDADGYLAITDRKKDIIVTSGGKNIAPQPIENALKTEPAHRRGGDDRRQAELPRRAGGAEVRRPWRSGRRRRGIAFRDREDLVRAARGRGPLRATR